MESSAEKKHPLHRLLTRPVLVVLLAISLIGAYYFFSIAGFSVWQSAFPEQQGNLDLLAYRMWLFGVLSAICILVAVLIAIALFRKRS